MYVFGSQEHCIVCQIKNDCYTTFHGAPPSGRVKCVCQHHLLSVRLVEVFVSYGVTVITCIHSFSSIDFQAWRDGVCQRDGHTAGRRKIHNTFFACMDYAVK
jgi:hypothetical protein